MGNTNEPPMRPAPPPPRRVERNINSYSSGQQNYQAAERRTERNISSNYGASGQQNWQAAERRAERNIGSSYSTSGQQNWQPAECRAERIIGSNYGTSGQQSYRAAKHEGFEVINVRNVVTQGQGAIHKSNTEKPNYTKPPKKYQAPYKEPLVKQDYNEHHFDHQLHKQIFSTMQSLEKQNDEKPSKQLHIPSTAAISGFDISYGRPVTQAYRPGTAQPVIQARSTSPRQQTNLNTNSVSKYPIRSISVENKSATPYTDFNRREQSVERGNRNRNIASKNSNLKIITKANNAASAITVDNTKRNAESANINRKVSPKNSNLINTPSCIDICHKEQNVNRYQYAKPKIYAQPLGNQKQSTKQHFNDSATHLHGTKNPHENLSYNSNADKNQNAGARRRGNRGIRGRKNVAGNQMFFRRNFKKANKPIAEESSNFMLFKREMCSKSEPRVSEFEDLEEEEDDDARSEVSSFSVCESNSEASDDDAEESSVESESISEFSMQSGIKYNKSISFESKTSSVNESYVSVFWDIENCPVPAKKSATDFVQKIRETFYENRTEKDFIIACDVGNLSLVVERELMESSVNVIHVSSLNKNAADAKLQSCLLAFQNDYRNSNAAVVLISADSDFSSLLNDMRYKHRIYINLLCKKNSRSALIKTAHKYIHYEDFVDELPDKVKEAECIVIASNVPTIEIRRIKSIFSRFLHNLNARIKNICPPEVEIIFSNQAVLEKALNLLDGLIIEGNQIEFTKAKASRIPPKTQKVKKVKEVIPKTTARCAGECMPQSTIQQRTQSNNIPSSNKATLVCVACFKKRDIDNWREKFVKDCGGDDEFTVEWQGDDIGGVLLINFRSLKKAQKAKKLIMKKQEIDPMVPRFMKLIKHSDDIGLGQEVCVSVNEDEIKRKKVEEHINIITSKQHRCLAQQEAMANNLRKNNSANVVGEKLREMNEQKVTFMNYTTGTIKKINVVDITSEDFDKNLNSILRDYTRECTCFTSALPIYAKKNAIVKAIKNNSVTIIRAETGSGKSTQLTQYIWRDGLCNGLIVCTQPRKIAVMSLAKYVSSQVGCALGDIVGYQVGLQMKRSAKTRILYATDHTLLQMMINDPVMNQISCVIVDEAHERTIYTDLLLGLLKRCLRIRNDLNVVITSATIDTSIFRDYFNVPDKSVLHISGKMFPIEDIWLDKNAHQGWNFQDKVIDKAYDIIIKEKMGDVLAFLTTPVETEKAAATLSERLKKNPAAKKVSVFYLHGRIDVQEQQKVFEKLPEGSRKVVFCTNCAETSVTIPGIKYVVDCGMVKDSRYYAERCMSVLSVGFVSRSSAEQRRGRAGRTQPGKCFRLYSRGNYESDMPESTDPEILRTNLGQAILKLMKLGVKDPLQFDFIQSPSSESLNAAKKQLVQLGAIDVEDWSLTQLGDNMTILPLEPRLSHLIFSGVKEGIGFESVVLAALVTVSRNIFFRNTGNKQRADEKVQQFCRNESDFLTYLEVYKEWFEVPKSAKSKWCVLNCINARSMMVAHELINELREIIRRELDVKINMKFSSDASIQEKLLNIIFNSFSQNLCIFSGHSKFGYVSADIPDEKLMIHPSSSLHTFGRWRPPYLVYDTVFHTSQTFLMNVSPATKEMVLDAVNSGKIKTDFTELSNSLLTPVCIKPIGETAILYSIIGKKGAKIKDLLKSIKGELGHEIIEIEASTKRGEVVAFSYEKDHQKILDTLIPSIEETKERFLAEFSVIPNICGRNELTALMYAGAELKDVLLPGEFKDVKLMLKGCDLPLAVERLTRYGPIRVVKAYENYFRVSFHSPLDARRAFKMHQDSDSFTLEGMHIKPNPLDAPEFYKVLVKVLRRPCIGEAYMGIDFPESTLSLLLQKVVMYQGQRLKFEKSKKSSDIRISNLPSDATQAGLTEVLQPLIPRGAKISKLLVNRKKPFKMSRDEFSVQASILQLFSEFARSENIVINMATASSQDFTYNALVSFKNPHDGANAVASLKGKKHLPNNLQFEMKPVVESVICCKAEIFSAVSEQIKEALKFFNKTTGDSNSLEIECKNMDKENMEIQITSNNIVDATDARNVVLGFLQGEQIKCDGDAIKEKLFTNTGLEFLKKLQKSHTGVHLRYNVHNKLISLFGTDQKCVTVKMEINAFLEHLENENFKEINLFPTSGKKGVLKALLTKYGHDLADLKTLCGTEEMKVDIHKQILTMKGSCESIKKCEAIIEEAKREVDGKDSEEENDDDACPVCTTPINESSSSRRLEYCGHAYCRECLLHLLECSSIFPIECVKCKSPIVMLDVRWACKEIKSLESELHAKAFKHFIETRDDIQCCPSPGCNMIYRVMSDVNDENVLICHSCNNVTCVRCCIPFHYGMNCELYQCYKNTIDGVDDTTLRTWLSEDPNGRKLCPSCSAPIEKNGGCNHITCWKCKADMCWRCRGVFPNGDAVYLHQPDCPVRDF